MSGAQWGIYSREEDLINKAAERLYVPKLGGEIGPSLLNQQIFFQGFFEAPHRVSEMLKGAVLAAKIILNNRLASLALTRRTPGGYYPENIFYNHPSH